MVICAAAKGELQATLAPNVMPRQNVIGFRPKEDARESPMGSVIIMAVELVIN